MSAPPDRVYRHPANWGQVKALFLEAVERSDSERRVFLARACAGDEELRRDVESLLASDLAAGSFCDRPAADLLGAPGESGARGIPRLNPGDRLDLYEITDFLGAGGMGEVYRARDARLDRDVAIKVVASGSAAPDARLRLVREARHAATLNHPNICTIHEVEESGTLPYIVMEYVEGRSLAEIVGSGSSGAQLALDYGIQVADAVAHAHERGLIHRDLKSSNIAINREGRAIVLDFGLARRLPESGAQSRTESMLTVRHGLVGTLSYMAPEVLLGSRADVRSDIWALGVLLYEIATGSLPFQGRTQFETSAAIIGDPPRAMPRHVPLALRLVIERCLAKDPANRYQKAADVRDALDAIRRRRLWATVRELARRSHRNPRPVAASLVAVLIVAAVIAMLPLLETGRQVPTVRTLAVLPLENASGAPELQYFADGVTDALISQIGASGPIRVISRTSVQRLVTSKRSLKEIGAALQADMVVQGSIRRTSDRVEMDLQLTHPTSGESLWSGRFEGASREVLVLQASAVRALADELRATLPARARERLTMVRTVDPAAYEEHLKGRFEWNQRTRDSLLRAVEHFTRAIAIDPTFAPAHAGLADCYNQLGTVIVGGGSPREYRPRAASAAIKALQIDGESAEAHAALGYVRHYEWRWDEAEREFRRATELNPSYSLARLWYGNLLMSRGRFDEALREATAARDLDPFSLVANANVGWILDFAARREEALSQLTKTLNLDPEYAQGHWRIAGVLSQLGRHDESLEHAHRFAQLSGRSPSSVGLLVQLNARAGRRDEAEAALRELLEISRRQYVSPAVLASSEFAVGHVDAALAWLERAFEEQSNLIAYLAVEPTYVSLHQDRRFQALLARAGLQ